jgi:3-dehydroquinate synthase
MENKIAELKNNQVYFTDEVSELDAFIEKSKYSKVVVLGDNNTIENCLPYLNLYSSYTSNADIIEIDAGEGSKNIDICIGIWNMMMDYEMDRKSLLLNVGGGMVSDIGAFAASTYMRGIDFINIPSSLLAMVDASHGGKNGIDVNDYKNMIGGFHFPKAVFIFPTLLDTLPAEEKKYGFAEIIKHGLIANADQYHAAMAYLQDEENYDLNELIIHSVLTKDQIVSQDPFDKNERKLLNYGHSIGHALESSFLALDSPISHGLAVLAGMIIENKIAVALGLLDPNVEKQIAQDIQSHYTLPKIKANTIAPIMHFLMLDKKNVDTAIQLSLITKIGEGKVAQTCSTAMAAAAIQAYSEEIK